MPSFLAPLVLAGLAAAEPIEIPASPVRAIAFLHVAPTGEPSPISRSDVLRAAERVLEAATQLTPSSVDPLVNEDCRGELACIARTVAGTDTDEAAPRWLLLLTQISLPGETDQVRLSLIDLTAVRRALADPFGPEPELAVEAAETRVPSAPVANSAELEARLKTAFAGPFAARLGSQGDLRPPGEIRLATTQPGAVITLDGRMVGITGDGPVHLTRVALGRHRIELAGTGTERWAEELELRPEAPLVHLDPSLTRAEVAASALRPTLVVVGSVLAVGGVTLAAIAASRTEDVRTACFAGQPGCSGGSSFVGFDYDPSSSSARAVDPPGVGMAAAGIALSTAGVGVALGALLEDGDDVPWVSLGLSVLAGGAALGGAVALDGAGVE